MKIVLAAAAVTVLVVFVGGRLVQAEKVARSSERKIRSVATTLEKAVADAPRPPHERKASVAEARWIRDVNTLCRREARELRALATPRSLAELETYLERALEIGRSYEAEFEALRPPRRYADAVKRLDRFSAVAETGLERMLAAARRGDPAAVLDEATALAALARRMNSAVLRLGLADCALPASGLPA